MAKESVVKGSLGTLPALAYREPESKFLYTETIKLYCIVFMDTALHSDAALLNLKGNRNEEASRALLDMNRIKRIHTAAFLSSFRPAC